MTVSLSAQLFHRECAVACRSRATRSTSECRLQLNAALIRTQLAITV